MNPTPWRGWLDIEGARLVDPSRGGWPPGGQLIDPPGAKYNRATRGASSGEYEHGGPFCGLPSLTLPAVGSSLYSRDPVHQGSNYADSRFELDGKSLPEPAPNWLVFGLGRGAEDEAGREN